MRPYVSGPGNFGQRVRTNTSKTFHYLIAEKIVTASMSEEIKIRPKTCNRTTHKALPTEVPTEEDRSNKTVVIAQAALKMQNTCFMCSLRHKILTGIKLILSQINEPIPWKLNYFVRSLKNLDKLGSFTKGCTDCSTESRKRPLRPPYYLTNGKCTKHWLLNPRVLPQNEEYFIWAALMSLELKASLCFKNLFTKGLKYIIWKTQNLMKSDFDIGNMLGLR